MSGDKITELYNAAPSDFPMVTPRTTDYTARQVRNVYGTDKPNLALVFSEAWKELRTYFSTDPDVRDLALFLYWSSQSALDSSNSHLELFNIDNEASDASENTSPTLGERWPTEEQLAWGHQIFNRAKERFQTMQIHRAAIVHFINIEGPWADDPGMQADIYELTWKMLKSAILRFREMAVLERSLAILDERHNAELEESYDEPLMTRSVDGTKYRSFEEFIKPHRRTKSI
ncbi:hypothetical protein DFP73DRAFT_598311 [Morchella snyderi]|nr:hypothetical protein DFP73DRAFT_598311 [Morchella snyderi]